MEREIRPPSAVRTIVTLIAASVLAIAAGDLGHAAEPPPKAGKDQPASPRKGPPAAAGAESAAAPGDGGGAGQAAGGAVVQRSNKMEFDERIVSGQTAKSGAVYLFKRVPRTLPALVAQRRSYRNRIVEPVLGDRPLKELVTPLPPNVPSIPSAAGGGKGQ